MGGLRLREDRKNRVTVNIYGKSYTIVGPEQASQVRMAASMVDDKMREIKRQNPYLDTKQLAVLTSINFANEFIKIEEQRDQLKEKNEKEEE